MKKTIIRIVNCVLVLSIIFSLISLPAGAQHVTELNATEVDAAAILVPQGVSQSRSTITFTCGNEQSGTFGNMLEVHDYRVYLQANKGIAFAGTGMITLMQIYDPDGVSIGTITTVSNTNSARYGVLTLPNKTGYYTIRVTGAMGGYTLNCLTGVGTTANTNTRFTRSGASMYASMYWQTYNSNFASFHPPYGQGDSINFISQCIQVGGRMPMITTGQTNEIWYYNSGTDSSSSWRMADSFMKHWTKVRASSYYGRAFDVKIYTKEYVLSNWATFANSLTSGNIVLYANGSNSEATHAAIISNVNTTTHSVGFYSHSADMNSGSLYDYINNPNYVSARKWIIIISIGTY